MNGRLIVVEYKSPTAYRVLTKEKRFAGDHATPVRIGEIVVFGALSYQVVNVVHDIEANVSEAHPSAVGDVYLVVVPADLLPAGVSVEILRHAKATATDT